MKIPAGKPVSYFSAEDQEGDDEVERAHFWDLSAEIINSITTSDKPPLYL